MNTERPSPWEHDFAIGHEFTPHKNQPGEPGYSDIFESLFGSVRGHREGFGDALIDEDDVNAIIAISLDEAYCGTTRQIILEVPTRDPNGRLIRQPKTLNVRIPKGVKAGQRIRMESQGNRGIGRGSQAGDL